MLTSTTGNGSAEDLEKLCVDGVVKVGPGPLGEAVFEAIKELMHKHGPFRPGQATVRFQGCKRRVLVLAYSSHNVTLGT